MMVLAVDAQEPPTISPLEYYLRVTSNFGERYDPIEKKQKFHRGIDLKAPIGTKVKATATGEVVIAEEGHAGHGFTIELAHSGGFKTKYSHLSQIDVKKGDLVDIGQVIGLSGNTGASTAPHLHYEVMKDGEYVDPQDYFTIPEENTEE